MSDTSQHLEPEYGLPVLRPRPLQPNPFFTGYDALLTTILPQQFQHHPLLLLSGQEAIGKTQVALEYACRFADVYETVLWLDGSSRLMLSHTINLLLDWPTSRSSRMQEREIFTFFQDWLQSHTKWLLVLDNIDDFALLDLIIPSEPHGHVFMTSRQTLVGPSSTVIVSSHVLSEATRRLLEQAQMIIIGPSALPSSEDRQDIPLSQTINNLFVPTLGTSLTNALAVFERRQASFQQERDGPKEVFRHNMVVQLLEEFSHLLPSLLLELLRLLVFLHPDEAIPQEPLSEAAQEAPKHLVSLLADPLALEQALSDLENEELLNRQEKGQSLRLHPGLTIVLVESLPQDEQRTWAGSVVRLLNDAFPVVRFDTRDQCERLLPLAERCATLVSQFVMPEGALLLERLGSFAHRQARYLEAETTLIQALDLYEHHLGMDSLDAAQVMNSLGLLYSELARPGEAEALHLRALEIRERVLGPEHPETAESLHNLAMVYGDLGQYERATDLYLRVLSLEESSKGADHPDLASTLNNLGLMFFSQGRDAEAETMYQRALTISERSLPSEHPDLAYPLDGLGALAERRGELQQAQVFYQRVFVLCRQAWGEHHPETANAINKLADIAEAQGNMVPAKKLYEQALAIGEQTLGAEHPDVALFLNNLAFLIAKQGQYEQAEPLYQRALTIYQQTWGEMHPDVANVLHNLGQLSRKMHTLEQAEAYMRHAYVIYEQVLGATRPDTIESLVHLADVLVDELKDEEAELILQHVLALLEQIPVPHHAQVVHVHKEYEAVRARLDNGEKNPSA